MKVLVSGSSGLIGAALLAALERKGHRVVPLVRRRAGANAVFWDPMAGMIDAAGLEDIDAVVHLAGENIAARRWSAAQKQRIEDSRVRGTALLSHTIAKLGHKPQVLVSASAIGYYGDRGDTVLREDSGPGHDFLGSVCRKWEMAAEPAAAAGIRVVHPRTGIVLAKEGGALPRMALPFRFGLGGRIGSGRQYMSWIALEDVVSAIVFFLENASIHGPVNAVSPSPVTNAEFTRVLARVLSRPALLPLPAFAARLALGEMADALLLASARVEPAKLVKAGFVFRHTDLEETLRGLLR